MFYLNCYIYIVINLRSLILHKYIGIRKSEFVTKNEFLCYFKIKMLHLNIYKVVISVWLLVCMTNNS